MGGRRVVLGCVWGGELFAEPPLPPLSGYREPLLSSSENGGSLKEQLPLDGERGSRERSAASPHRGAAASHAWLCWVEGQRGSDGTAGV